MNLKKKNGNKKSNIIRNNQNCKYSSKIEKIIYLETRYRINILIK
jgi:hypothetical protein